MLGSLTCELIRGELYCDDDAKVLGSRKLSAENPGSQVSKVTGNPDGGKGFTFNSNA